MPKYKVTGEICCGVFTTSVEAASEEEAVDLIDGQKLDWKSERRIIVDMMSYEPPLLVALTVGLE